MNNIHYLFLRFIYFCSKGKFTERKDRDNEKGGHKEEGRERETEILIFYWLVHSPNGTNGSSWAEPKQEAGTSSGFLKWVHWPQDPSLLCYFSRNVNRELDWK